MNYIFVLLSVGLISLTPLVYGDFSDTVQERYESSLWKLGDGVKEGDSIEYKICSDKTILQVIHPYHCYNVSLEFVTILESYQGKVWVVQGNFTTPEINQQMIFLIDPITFQIQTDKLNVDLGNSISNTIFSLSQYGVQSLNVGQQWGMIPSYFTHDVPLEIKRHELIDTPAGEFDSVILGYDVVQESNYYISNDFSFPVKGEILSPNIIFPAPIELFYFELVSFSNVGNYDNNYNKIHIDSFSEIPDHFENSNIVVERKQ